MPRVQCFLIEPTGEEKEIRAGEFAPLYHMPDGSLATLRDVPPGAMLRATWNAAKPCESQDDGAPLVVKLPDGDFWYIDSRADNCTMPDDTTHHCWIRHGVPPVITVDKQGKTCGAGGGSIQSSHYHGFLRNGWLED